MAQVQARNCGCYRSQYVNPNHWTQIRLYNRQCESCGESLSSPAIVEHPIYECICITSTCNSDHYVCEACFLKHSEYANKKLEELIKSRGHRSPADPRFIDAVQHYKLLIADDPDAIETLYVYPLNCFDRKDSCSDLTCLEAIMRPNGCFARLLEQSDTTKSFAWQCDIYLSCPKTKDDTTRDDVIPMLQASLIKHSKSRHRQQPPNSTGCVNFFSVVLCNDDIDPDQDQDQDRHVFHLRVLVMHRAMTQQTQMTLEDRKISNTVITEKRKMTPPNITWETILPMESLTEWNKETQETKVDIKHVEGEVKWLMDIHHPTIATSIVRMNMQPNPPDSAGINVYMAVVRPAIDPTKPDTLKWYRVINTKQISSHIPILIPDDRRSEVCEIFGIALVIPHTLHSGVCAAGVL